MTSSDEDDWDLSNNQCCVWKGSAVDSWTVEENLPQFYGTDPARCIEVPIYESNENGTGWKPICATHAGVMKRHVEGLPVRDLVHVITEEPERTDEEIDEIVEGLWVMAKKMGKELHELHVRSPGYKPPTVKSPDIDDLLKSRLRESLRGSLRKK